MKKEEVISLMKSSKDSLEWGRNCDVVKSKHNNDYPDYWYQEIILSGLMDEVLGDGASTMKITSY